MVSLHIPLMDSLFSLPYSQHDASHSSPEPHYVYPRPKLPYHRSLRRPLTIKLFQFGGGFISCRVIPENLNTSLIFDRDVSFVSLALASQTMIWS